MFAINLFNPSAFLGLLGLVLAPLSVIVMAYAYLKAGTSKVWQETAAGYEKRAEQLEAELKIATDRISALETMVAELRTKTDVTSVREAVALGNEKISQQTADIAKQLSKQTAEIADRLSRENAHIAERLVTSNELVAAKLSLVATERSERLAKQIDPKSTAKQVADLSDKIDN